VLVTTASGVRRETGTTLVSEARSIQRREAQTRSARLRQAFLPVGPRYLPALDGVRALAVLLVISWHLPGGSMGAVHGNNGVTLFFVLSGYLITTLALSEETRNGRFSYPRFLVRRIFRILPMMWLVVATYAVLVLGLGFDPRRAAFRSALPFYLLYLPEYPVMSQASTHPGDAGPVPLAGLWSLGFEEKFYLLWPVVAFVILRARRWRGWAAAAASVPFFLFPLVEPRTSRMFVWYAPILAGCALAFVLSTGGGTTLRRVLARPWTGAAAIFALTVSTLTAWPTWTNVIFSISACLLISHAVEARGGLVFRILCWSPIRVVGVISYGLYLFHSLGLKIVDRAIPPSSDVLLRDSLVFVLSLGLLIPGLAILNLVFERPLQRLGASLVRRGRTAHPHRS